MLTFPGRVRLPMLVFGCLLIVAAAVAGAFAVEAAAKKMFKRPGHGRHWVLAHRLALPQSAFAAKLPFKKRLYLGKRGTHPATQQQAAAAPPSTAPKAAFRAQGVRPPVRLALVRPTPYRPVAAAPLVKPVSLPPDPAAALAPPSRPDGAVLLAQKGDWSVFRRISGDSRTCFVATRPKDSSPRLADRKPVYLYLTSYAPGDTRNEVTIKLGMPVESEEVVVAVVDGYNYRLAASGDMAYAMDIGGQRAMLEGMRHGNSLTLRMVKADAAPGSAPLMTDAFSLLGLATALKLSDAACAEVSDRR